MIRNKFSAREVGDAVGDVLTRFPLVVAAAVTAVVLGITAIEINDNERQNSLVTGVMVCGLAVPFLISLKLFSESRGQNNILTWSLQIAGAALMVVYWFTLPEDPDHTPFKYWYHFATLAFAAHLLVSFAPFTRKGHNTEFWDYNQRLFFRWLIGALYAAVLFGGLAAAMGAVDVLFNVSIRPERYAELWVLCAGIFHPLFFLAGVPRTFESEDDALLFPRMLRWFCVYILIPIVLIYLAILYAYFGKIGLEWNFPRGWVANLGLGFSVTGILALLLVYPVRERDDQPFIRLYYRWYFVVLLPVIALLFLAIGKRLSQYGFTEERYIVFVLGLWLAVVALYFIFISRHRIKIIPMTLFVAAMLSAFGPWSMFSVSRMSQMSRLKSFLKKENMLDNDMKIVKATKAIDDSSVGEISQITRYLTQTHGPRSLQTLYHQPVDSIVESKEPYEQSNALVEAMGLEFRYFRGSSESNYYSYGARQNRLYNVSGFDAMLMLNYYGQRGDELHDSMGVNDQMMRIRFTDEKNMIIELPEGDTALFNVKEFTKRLNEKFGRDQPEESDMNYELTKAGYRFRLQMISISGKKENGTFELDGYDAYLLAGETKN